MKKNIKEALAFFVAGIIFLLCTLDFIFPVIAFLFKACLFIIGCILILAAAGNISEKDKDDSNNTVDNKTNH